MPREVSSKLRSSSPPPTGLSKEKILPTGRGVRAHAGCKRRLLQDMQLGLAINSLNCATIASARFSTWGRGTDR